MMDIENRNQFLGNLAENLGRPRSTTGVERPDWTIAPQWDMYKDYTQDELTDVLQKQCESIHTTFKKTTLEQLAHTLTDAIESYNARSIIAVNEKRNAEYKLDDIYIKLQEKQTKVHLWDPKDREGNIRFAEQADVGITFSDITLAESGTVALFNNKHNGRSISLLPRAHIVIIPKSTIVPRMTQAANKIHQANSQGNPVPSCISFISGPSNSADIEMNLIVGVHGPIEVTYIVVEDK